MRVAAMTLGPHGALAREAGKFTYSPGFVVNCVDTTGAGDVFHGAFCYSVLKGFTVRDAVGRAGWYEIEHPQAGGMRSLTDEQLCRFAEGVAVAEEILSKTPAQRG